MDLRRQIKHDLVQLRMRPWSGAGPSKSECKALECSYFAIGETSILLVFFSADLRKPPYL